MEPIRALVPFVHVADMQVSMDFYQRIGFEVKNTHTPDGETLPVWAYLVSDRAQIMIAKASAPIIAGEQAVFFYVYVDDVQAKHAELTANGFAPAPIKIQFWAPQGEFRLMDPDGYLLMITHT
ncbi:MAG TPA: VOC family protein [Thermoanaerobaculia bacterium]